MYRRLKNAFDGTVEEGAPPQPLTMPQLLAKLNGLNVIFGKKSANSRPKTRGKGRPDKCEWKKKSIFFSLPYWEHLYVRHCLDVMHIEKNVCDSLLGTLLNVKGKTKDNKKARLDMGLMKIRPELAPQKRGERTYLPPASCTLSKQERDKFCDFFSKIKVPSGFSANVQSLVNLKEAKLQEMKSHDCHVVMQEFLPIAIRNILPKDVRNSITRLCFFFKKICNKVIDVQELDSLQRDIVLTICQLEMYFPPSFFDIMFHLTLHLVKEIKFCGPVYIRWMYPVERLMKVLKGYVKNRFRPEGCIVERYIVEESAEFCAEYLSATEAIGLPKKLSEDVTEGRGTSGLRVKEISKEMWHQALLYVLHNSNEVEPYVEEHLSYLRSQYPTRKTEKWIQDEHNRSFVQWLSKKILEKCTNSPQLVSSTLFRLSQGPLFDALSFSGFEINGYTFYTSAHDKKSTNQNSGVTLVAESMHISSAKDKNPIHDENGQSIQAKDDTSDMRAIYMASAMCQLHASQSLWLAPYNSGSHWMLAMINPHENKVYWLDPLRGSIPEDFAKMCTTALNTFQTRVLKSKSSVSWINIKKCPLQPNMVLCGLFICRMTRDIVEYGAKTIPESYFPGSSDSYTQEQIDEVTDEWLGHVAPYLQMVG